MLGRTPEVETLRLLYADAAARTPDGVAWHGFLTALTALARAQGAALLIDAGDGAIAAHALPPCPALPPRDALARMRPGRIYAQGELFDGAPRPAPMRAVRASLRGGGHAWLLIARRGDDFRAVDAAHLGRLADHLAQAVDIWLALHAERARAAQSGRLARALGVGWLWIEPPLRVREADLQARRMLAGGGAARLSPGGAIDIAEPAAARDLRRAIEAAAKDGGAKRGGAAQMLWLDRAAGLQMVVLPGLERPAPGDPPVLRAALRQAPVAAALDATELARALGITRSEARLAQRLCDGDTLAEAARHLGWTLETARSASKRIFAATGLRGQTALVRHLLNGAWWLAIAPD